MYNKRTWKMKQKLNKLVRQKTKMNKVIGKICYNKEINEDKIKEIINEIETFKRAIRNRKKYNKKYDDSSLKISELKRSIIHYKKCCNYVKR